MKKRFLFGILMIVMCLVMVGCGKKMNELEGVSMIIKDGTLTKTSATIIITDVSGKENTYGEWFRIDKKENSKWKELKTKEDSWVNLVSHTVDEDNKLELIHNWKSLYGELEPGEYRLVKEVNNEYISVEFKID